MRTHLWRSLKKDSQSRITLGSPEGGICAHYQRSQGEGGPGKGPYYAAPDRMEMVALDQVHIWHTSIASHRREIVLSEGTQRRGVAAWGVVKTGHSIPSHRTFRNRPCKTSESIEPLGSMRSQEPFLTFVLGP